MVSTSILLHKVSTLNIVGTAITTLLLPSVHCAFVLPSHAPIINNNYRWYDHGVFLSIHRRTHDYHHLLLSSTPSEEGPTAIDNNKPTPRRILTNAIFQIAYDGTQFHGWSAANDGARIQPTTTTGNQQHNHLPVPSKRSRSRRNKNRPSVRSGTIRSVQGAIRNALAKIYGDVDPDCVFVEGCSRTDKGVHAKGMVALVYCVRKNEEEGGSVSEAGTERAIVRYPSSTTDDSCYLPLPFNSDLAKIVYVLNRMLPPDIRIVDASPAPYNVTLLQGEEEVDMEENLASRSFHPSLHTKSKTYRYTFSVGDFHDPIRCRTVWHIDRSRNRTFNLTSARTYASTFVGTHDFRAFQGAERGSGRDKPRNNTICTVSDISIIEEESVSGEAIVADDNNNDCKGPKEITKKWSIDAFPSIDGKTLVSYSSLSGSTTKPQQPSRRTFCITVTGDRFLYKMVRFLAGAIVTYGLDGEHPSEEGNVGCDDSGSSNNGGDSDGDTMDGPRWYSRQRMCAPAYGLALDKVRYGEDWRFEWNSEVGERHDQEKEYRRTGRSRT